MTVPNEPQAAAAALDELTLRAVILAAKRHANPRRSSVPCSRRPRISPSVPSSPGRRLIEPLLSRFRHRCTTVTIDGPSLREPQG